MLDIYRDILSMAGRVLCSAYAAREQGHIIASNKFLTMFFSDINAATLALELMGIERDIFADLVSSSPYPKTTQLAIKEFEVN